MFVASGHGREAGALVDGALRVELHRLVGAADEMNRNICGEKFVGEVAPRLLARAWS